MEQQQLLLQTISNLNSYIEALKTETCTIQIDHPSTELEDFQNTIKQMQKQLNADTEQFAQHLSKFEFQTLDTMLKLNEKIDSIAQAVLE